MNVLAWLLIVATSLIHRPTTKEVKWASPTQGDAFEYGPYPQCLSGGWGAGKTWTSCLKGIWLSSEYPKNRGVVARHVGKELRATTMATWYKVCPPHLYDSRRGGRRSDQAGMMRFADTLSEVLFLHLDDPETEGIIRGLEINWFLIDQGEENAENMEEIFDMLLGRLGRWDIAEVPERRLEAYRQQYGKEWPYRHPETDRPVPPPYAMIDCNPDQETHWLYRRFHPESQEHQTFYAQRGYKMFHMPSMENRFLGEINRQFLLAHDAAFIRRNVDGIWGMPEGAIHAVDKLSIIDGSDELLDWVVRTCILFRVMDHGDSSPTVCAWWGVDKDGNLFCVAPETKVLTGDLQWIEAREVRPGTLLAGFDEQPSSTGRRRWRESFALATREVDQPCYRLTLSDGTVVVCSANHQWLVNKSGNTSVWRTTERIAVGQRIVKAIDPWKADESWGAGYLAAAFDGEGDFGYSTAGTPRMGFTQRPNAVLQRVVHELALRGIAGTVNRSKASTVKLTLDRKQDVLKLLGQCRPGRLLPKLDLDRFAGFRGASFPAVVKKEFLGVRKVIAIETTTGTYIAEGLASHNCYREYYQPNTIISRHRQNIFDLSPAGERYELDLADPSIFYKMPTKQGGRFTVADEYLDAVEQPKETAIAWTAADNNELGTRNRINEYLAVDPERIHPIYKSLGSPRLFFLKATPTFPQGVYHALRETRAQRRVKVGTDLGKPVFSDERDPTIVDHAYDPVRYMVASRPRVPKGASQAKDGTFFGVQQRIAALHRKRMGIR